MDRVGGSEPFLRYAASLASAITVDEVARVVLAEGAGCVGASACMLATPSDRARGVEVSSSDSLDPAVAARWTSIPLTSPLPLIRAIRRQEPVFENVDAPRPDLGPDWEAAGAAAYAVFPLAADGEALGSVGFLWMEPQPFDDPQRERMRLVAEWAGLALERALLRAFERRLTTAMEQRLRLASLEVGHRVDAHGEYLPAWAGIPLGGDWYDGFLLPDGRIALVVGDVAGHGTGVAPEMIALRQITRAAATGGGDPGTMLGRLDGYVGGLDGDTMASVLVMVLDPIRRTLSWANGGLPWPLLRRPDGSVERLYEGRVPVLGGGIGDRSSPAASIPVEDGTVVIAYTDGMYDGRTTVPEGRQDELEAIVARHGDGPVEALLGRLVEAARANPLRSDDLAVLAARITFEAR